MQELTEAQRAVLAKAAEELSRLGQDQQALADDLAGLMPPSDEVVRRMQSFDLLRQRIDLLAGVLAVLRATPSADLARAVPACLTLAELRRGFAEALGVAEDADDGGDEIELF